MNAFDRHRRKVTAWCEDCNSVFDEIGTADHHQAQKEHKIKVTEFWVTGRV
jgi:hypothetical protein